jgi:LysM repeat protein
VKRRWATRVAAPAAFLAGVTVAVLLVRAGLDGGTPTTAAQTSVATATSPPTTTQAQTGAVRRVFVRVGAGDTLDQIALDNDTSVERLLTLNPGLDPTALQVGQRIRVR